MKTIPLTQGKVALVSDEDFGRLGLLKWCAHREGRRWYAVRRTGGKIQRMHRAILEGPGDVDHINGNGLDNRRENLRLVSRRQNLRNQTRKSTGCSSRFRGVCWDKSRGKWVAYITLSSGRKHLGRFTSEEEAARAYDAAGFARDPDHFTPNFVVAPLAPGARVSTCNADGESEDSPETDSTRE